MTSSAETTLARTTPADAVQPGRARSGLPRKWYVLAVAAVAVALAVSILAWTAGRFGNPPGIAAGAPRLRDLPALPEDIEAHAAKARPALAPDDARARNAAVPFSAEALIAARPFAFTGTDEDRARALQCLSAAVLYEAGDDTVGQAAVAQVVLNRVRHAAFPATVCGVVYQGSQRTTGCQFTFTCDGSLSRRMPDAAWQRARQVADRALAGGVDTAVGLATHYHTDWVYPYWSPELRKLARVGTHLFFGWPGSWGGPYAFRRTYRGNEGAAGPAGPAVLADAEAGDATDLGPPKILGLPQAPARLPSGMGKVPLYGARLRLARPDGGAFGLLAPPGGTASQLVNAALALCAEPGPCQVLAWANEDDIPGEFPVPAGARGTMVFEYVRAGAGGKGSLRFDCAVFPNRDPKLCLRPPGDRPAALSGIRWVTEPGAAAPRTDANPPAQ